MSDAANPAPTRQRSACSFDTSRCSRCCRSQFPITRRCGSLDDDNDDDDDDDDTALPRRGALAITRRITLSTSSSRSRSCIGCIVSSSHLSGIYSLFPNRFRFNLVTYGPPVGCVDHTADRLRGDDTTSDDDDNDDDDDDDDDDFVFHQHPHHHPL